MSISQSTLSSSFSCNSIPFSGPLALLGVNPFFLEKGSIVYVRVDDVFKEIKKT